MLGHRAAQRVEINAALRIAGRHLLPHGPAEQFQLAVADLKTVEDFHVSTFDVEKNDIIALFHFPARRDAGGNNIDIAMDAEPAMAPWASAAMDVDRWTDVDNDDRMVPGGDFDDAGRVATETRAGVH